MNYIRVSIILLIVAVITGAFGAHALKKVLETDQLTAWHTAVEYQFYHGLGLLLLCTIPEKNVKSEKRWLLAKRFLLVGTILFCGSIYFLSTQSLSEMPMSFLGLVTPIGGLFFIAGWMLALFSVKS